MEQQKNKPKLRFPEFKGEWESKKLGDLTEKIGDGLHGTPIYSDDSDIYFINGNNLTDGKIEINETTKKVDLEILTKNYKKLNTNTLLISINGTIGSIAKYNNEKVMLGKSVGYLNFIENIDFYYHVFHTETVQNFFNSELTGSTIKNLSLKTLRETNISLPSLPEQQKIAAFLTSVDERIAQLTKKKALLEQYKKGVMQRIFSQEIRFKDDNGKEFGVWEEKTLSYFLTIPEKQKPSVIDRNKLLTVKLHTKGVFKNDNTDSLSLGANYFIRKKGQFIYGKQNLFNGAFSLIPDEFDGWLSSTDVPSFNVDTNKVNPVFFLQYFSREFFYKKLEDIASGSGSKRIHENVLLQLRIDLPSIQEQTKIANFLSAIDKKIEGVDKQLEQTKRWKKGLLQQMFC